MSVMIPMVKMFMSVAKSGHEPLYPKLYKTKYNETLKLIIIVL